MTNFPTIMGILNVTPDSFSDGGAYTVVDRAVAHAEQMLAEGADIIDIGGESTRPGAQPVSADEECTRVLPVIKALRERAPEATISIDTSKAAVAQAALDCGARIVNDVTAGRDPEMLELVAQQGTSYIAMHMQGEPRSMQTAPTYDDVVAEVLDFFNERVRACEAAGIARDKVWLDPGIGFGKTLEHNLEILRQTNRFVELGHPLVIGVSRKSIVGALLDGAPPAQRIEGSLALAAHAVALGAQVLRVHDVAATRRFFQVWAAVTSPV